MDKDHKELISFVLEAALTLPSDRRASVYRGLASICGDQAKEEHLLEMANAITTADQICRHRKFSVLQWNTLRP